MELRYGCIMIMADQDTDGSHIKGLIINFIDYFWNDLLKFKGFIKQFVTPIIKCFKNSNSLQFYSQQEYREWAQGNGTEGYKIKYYKGLGTSTDKEGKEYFKNLEQNVK